MTIAEAATALPDMPELRRFQADPRPPKILGNPVERRVRILRRKRLAALHRDRETPSWTDRWSPPF